MGTVAVSLDAVLQGRHAVSLLEAKLHLRLATTPDAALLYTQEDDLLVSLLTAACDIVESETGRQMVSGSRTEYLEDWPAGSYIELPSPPLVSVEDIYYYADGDAVETTVDSSTYDVDVRSEPGRIVLASGESWPTDSLRPAMPIRIVYTAGYGEPSAVPEPLRCAVKLLLTDLYEHRGEVVVGAAVARIDAVRSLLDPYRMWYYA